MRRTDDEFIKEVYERRKKHLKKKKQQIAIIAVLLPVAVFGALVGPAMLPAASADKSAPPAGTVTAAPSEKFKLFGASYAKTNVIIIPLV